MPRHDSRRPDELRPVTLQRPFESAAAGSVLISCGQTTVLCTASLDESVPPWRRAGEGEPQLGWVTAEYSMLPGSTAPRKSRRADGRSTEIQRLIGRSLRSVVDFAALGGRTVTIDCDVVRADGGTRTTSITGGFLALKDALQGVESATGGPILKDSVAAVSVGVVDLAGDGPTAVCDLDYPEDSTAEVDLNVVMTGSGKFVEVQGTAEGEPFDRATLDRLLDLAAAGCAGLTEMQREA
ncbi:MAG: ribonuclease PH [Planctomycetota bacterium]